MRRSMLPLALLLGFLLWWNYGTLTVPAGMDTMPEEYPPGSLCVIEKRPGSVAPGEVVFFEWGGGMLLSRVSRVEGDRFWVEHDAPDSRFPDGDELGAIGVSAVYGLVLTAFVGEPALPEGADGRGR